MTHHLEKCARLRLAARRLHGAGADLKNKVLRETARLLEAQVDAILEANAADLAALGADATPSFRDRLTLNPPRIRQMIDGLDQVALLPDPVREIVEERTLKNGLLIRRVRVPLGVIFIIFESRPNVVVEAFSLAFKAGNALILRGGKESMRTTDALCRLMSDALAPQGLPPDCLWGIADPDRELVRALLQRSGDIDVVIPRGGSQLIEFVVQNSRIPIIKNDRGLCHVYLHEDADEAMSLDIVADAKASRPGVCNAMETLLVHAKAAPEVLPKIYERLKAHQVEWFCCPRALGVLRGKDAVNPVSADSYDTEYLDFKMNCRVVDSLEDAVAHIALHGSRHSEAIVTSSALAASFFEAHVDAAAVYWNASTRFTDGYELGLGGEIGVSTQKLHVRGPVGLSELTSIRWIIEGKGQVRG